MRGAGAAGRGRRRGFSCAQLVTQLRARGYRSDLVAVPFKWHPKEEIFSHAAAWRLLDLTEVNGERVDCGDRDEVPLVLRAPPEQVDLAAAPAPRRVRSLRPPVLRGLRLGRDGRGGARAPNRPRHARDRRGPARLHHQLGGHRAPRAVQRAVRAAAVPPAAPGPAAAARAPAATTCSRSGAWRRSSGWTWRSAGWRSARPDCGWWWSARGRSAPPSKASPRSCVSGTACGSPAGWTTRR